MHSSPVYRAGLTQKANELGGQCKCLICDGRLPFDAVSSADRGFDICGLSSLPVFEFVDGSRVVTRYRCFVR